MKPIGLKANLKSKKPSMNRDAAEALALSGLGFLAEDPNRLGRFLSLSGMGPDELRAEAGSAHVMTAVLDYLLEDESLLLVFAGMKGLDPASVAEAHRLLAGEGAHREWM